MNDHRKSSPPANMSAELAEQDREQQMRHYAGAHWGTPRKGVTVRKATPQEQAMRGKQGDAWEQAGVEYRKRGQDWRRAARARGRQPGEVVR